MERRAGFPDDVDDLRRRRKRKAQPNEESNRDKSMENAVQLIKVTTLSVPKDYSAKEPSAETLARGTPIMKKRRIVHQISLEREKSPGKIALEPRYSVSLRNIDYGKRDVLQVEEDRVYKKALKKAKFWRKLFPWLRDEAWMKVRTTELTKGRRFFLTYSIAHHLKMKSSVFIKIRDLMIHVMFMSLLSFISIGTYNSESFHFTEIVLSVFTECFFYCHGRKDTLTTVRTLAEFRCYVEFCLKPGLTGGLWGKPAVDSGIVLLTVPRFRQLRVKNSTCHVGLIPGTRCFGRYTEEDESTDTYGPGTEGYVYSKSEEAPVYFRGYYSKYSNNGFSYLISKFSNSTAYMPGPYWVDESTRAVFIDFVLYSPNTNYFCAVQYLFEMPVSGLVKPFLAIRATFLLRYHSRFGHYVFCAEIMTMFMSILYVIEVLADASFFRYRYFTSMGGLYNIALTIHCWYVGYVLVRRQVAVHAFFNQRFLKSDFVDFQPVFAEHVYCLTMVAILFFFASFKTYGYLSFDLMEHLKITMQTSIKDIIVFVAVFTIMLWAFVQVAHLLFGHMLERYRSFTSTFSELTTIVLGDLDFKGPMMIHKVIGPVFILTFVIFAVFVLISMFFAIINSTFIIVSNIVDIETESYVDFLRHCCRKMGAKFRRSRRSDQDEKEEKKMKNSKRIRNLLLSAGYTDIELKLFSCRYVVDDEQDLESAVFEKMRFFKIPPERMKDLEQITKSLVEVVDAMVVKSDWIAKRVKEIQEKRLNTAPPQPEQPVAE